MESGTFFCDAITATTRSGTQLCPAIFLSSPLAIPSAVKHIYSQLAANADEVDHEMADLVISLIAHGNQLSHGYERRLEEELSSLLSECSCWMVSSGRSSDPFASVAANSVALAEPVMNRTTEILHLCVGRVPGEEEVVDTSLSTLFVVSRSEVEKEEDSAIFRALFASRLSRPPPALLIGLPSHPLSHQSPAILLSRSLDPNPLAVSIFAGASLSSLHELTILIEAGVPALVLEDSCELCLLLQSAVLFSSSPSFSHSRFSSWLDARIPSLALSSLQAEDLNAKELLMRLFATLQHSPQLIDFISRSELQTLASRLLELCSSCSEGSASIRILSTAAKLNCSHLLDTLGPPSLLEPSVFEKILVDGCGSDERVEFVSELLRVEGGTLPEVSLLLLKKILSTGDIEFFKNVVGSRLGFEIGTENDIDDWIINSIDNWIYSLTGVSGVFVVNGPCNSCSSLSVALLLTGRPRLSLLFALSSSHPTTLCLVLSATARAVSSTNTPHSLYSSSLASMSMKFEEYSLSILRKSFTKSPRDSYCALSQPLSHFGGRNLAQVAFQCEAGRFLAHPAASLWLSRLETGGVCVRELPILSWLPPLFLWLLCILFVLPIRCLLSLSASPRVSSLSRESATVSLLSEMRSPRRGRAMSTYSLLSSRSDLLPSSHMSSFISAPLALPAADTPTPQSGTASAVPFGVSGMDESDRLARPQQCPRHSTTLPSLRFFFSTPKTKWIIFLLFRLIYLAFLAFSIAEPGCGGLPLSVVMWLWSFSWWAESAWLLSCLQQRHPSSSLRSRLVDVAVHAVLLCSLLFFQIQPQLAPRFRIVSSGYPSRVMTAVFFLYASYSSLVFLSPLFESFGRFIIVLRIILIKNFFNFLALILIIFSTHAVVFWVLSFPDRPVTLHGVSELLWSSALSLLRADSSPLLSSPAHCANTALSRPAFFCSTLSSNREKECPAEGVSSSLALLHFLALSHLLLLPFLLAFFIRDSQSLEEEADRVWRVERFASVDSFAARPPLPPPLTAFSLIFVASCRRGMQAARSLSAYHPDMVGPRTILRLNNGSVYRNPSVPHDRHENPEDIWRSSASELCREVAERSEKDKKSTMDNENEDSMKRLSRQIRTFALSMTETGNDSPTVLLREPYGAGEVERAVVPEDRRDWMHLWPSYSPPCFSLPLHAFPPSIATNAESTTIQSLEEIRQKWRSRQSEWLLLEWKKRGNEWWKSGGVRVSGSGLPLNPNGRRGLSGRGSHPKFGPNISSVYALFTEDNKVLLDSSKELPSEFRNETGARDEFLSSLLHLVGVSDPDLQMLSMRGPEETGDDCTKGARLVLTRSAGSTLDTDHAWLEEHLFTLHLGSRGVLRELLGYAWYDYRVALNAMSPTRRDLLRKAASAAQLSE